MPEGNTEHSIPPLRPDARPHLLLPPAAAIPPEMGTRGTGQFVLRTEAEILRRDDVSGALGCCLPAQAPLLASNADLISDLTLVDRLSSNSQNVASYA